MNWGLLWFDADKKSDLAAKVTRAADRYQEKFGRRPDLCYVNASQVDGVNEVGGVRIVGAKNILKFHFWIGENGTEEETMQTTTTQAVACARCGQAASIAADERWLCDGCHAAERIAVEYLKTIGKLSQATLDQAMQKYLESRSQDADQPTPPEPQPFRKCPRCKAEPVYGVAWVCWQCGYDARRVK